jgi:hypothetical protein
MKFKILIAFFILLSAMVKGQFVPQSLGGSPVNKNTVRGAFVADSSIAIHSYPDTITANLGANVKLENGLMIKVGKVAYMRNTATSEWVIIGGTTSVNSVTGSGNIASSGGSNPNITLTGILPISNGGTGTVTPFLVAGTNITITGTWPNQTINSTGSGGSGITAIGVATANGFGGTSSGSTTPVLTLTTPLTGILKGNGTAMLAAVPGTDFVTIPQLGTKVDTSYKIKVARPLYVTIADSTLHSDTVSLSKAGVLKPGYVTNSNDTLATKADVRAGGGGGSGGTVTNVSAITLGTTGTDLTSTVATPNTTPVITLNVPNASAANRGALLAADWTIFNGKQTALGFTPYNATNPSGYISSYTETDPIVKAINGIVKSNGTTISAAAAGTDYVIPSGSITGNAATVTTNANLTGPVTSTGNATAIGTGAISNTMLANSAVALLSGTNSGDNATNTQYSGLVTNANHTGDATGSTVLTLATVNSNVGTFNSLTVNAKGLVTAASNVASGGTTDYQTQTATAAQAVFTFTSVPSSYNDFWLDIWGVVVPQSSYTKSGSIITFTGGLNAGDPVGYHRTK